MNYEKLGEQIVTQFRFISGSIAFGMWMHSYCAGIFMYFAFVSFE